MNQIENVIQQLMENLMHLSMQKFFVFSKEKNIPLSQLGVLTRIHHKGLSGISQIGEEIGITSAGASQMVEKLVQQDYICRSEDPNDRRFKKINLTSKGIETVEACLQARETLMNELIKSLSPEEQQQTIEVLSRLTSIIKEMNTKFNNKS